MTKVFVWKLPVTTMLSTDQRESGISEAGIEDGGTDEGGMDERESCAGALEAPHHNRKTAIGAETRSNDEKFK